MNNSKGTKLRNLKLRKVDLVDQGANQHAHIQLAKRDGEAPEADGTPEERAFFERLGKFFAKMFHTCDPVEKSAQTFDEVTEQRDVRDVVYRITDAMCESIFAIINDTDITDAQKAQMIAQTAEQVASAIKTDVAGAFGAAVQKSESEEGEGTPAPDEGGETESPAQEPEATGTSDDTDEATQQKGENDMNLDISKMSPEDKALYEELQKRYATEAEPATPTQTPAPAETETSESDDVYKGLHPAVKAEIESLRKFREESEMRELKEVAKKYALLGKKPDELATVLKSLRDAGGSAYDDMISILDSNLEAVEKSGVFGEIGKRGSTDNAGSNAWGKIEAAAQEIAKSKPGMIWAEAVDAACIQHPELVEQYENSRR